MSKRKVLKKKRTGARNTPRRDAREALVGILKDSMKLVDMFNDGKANIVSVSAKRNIDLATHEATAKAWAEVLDTEQYVLGFIRKQDQTAGQAESLLKGKGDWAVVGDEVTMILVTLQSQQDEATAKVSQFIMGLAEVEWPVMEHDNRTATGGVLETASVVAQ